MRSSLVSALVSCADSPCRLRARRFVQGLSSDELQFIAGFLGTCVLDSSAGNCASRAEWAERIARYRQSLNGCSSADLDHKAILLLEYLCRAGDARSQVPAAS